ncbi:MAG: PAS domain S-box protein [Bacteroidales bacterium]|nr:PAS domain S-box protein [Bacteroidales bacterium]
MNSTIKILIVENNKTEILKIEHYLKKSDFKYFVEYVHSLHKLKNTLNTFKPDIILLGCNFSEFLNSNISEIILQYKNNIPFIIITDPLTDKTIEKLYQKGITDYILKEDLIRLLPTIKRALKQNKTIDTFGEKQFEFIFEEFEDPIIIVDVAKDKMPVVKKVNNAVSKVFKFKKADITGSPLNKIVPHIPKKEIIECVTLILKEKKIRKKISVNIPNNKNSKFILFDFIANIIIINNKKYIIIKSREITERHYYHTKISKQKETLKKRNKTYLEQNIKLFDKIIKQKKTQKALTEKIDIINNSPIVSFSLKNKPGWPVSYVSDNIYRNFGYRISDFINKNITFEDIIYKEDMPYLKNEIKTNNTGNSIRINHKPYRIITKNKTIKWVTGSTFIIQKNGETTNFEVIVYDISENIKKQKALQESEKKYRSILNANPDIITICSKDKKLQYMNTAAVNKFGYKENGVTCYKALFGFEKVCSWCGHEYADKYGCFQNEVVFPGDYRYLLGTFSKINNNETTDYLCLYKDITELKSLQNERLDLLSALETGLNEVYIINPSSFNIMYANSKSYKNLGISNIDILKHKIYYFQSGQNKKTYIKYLKKLKANKEVYFETSHKTLNNKKYPVSVYLKLVKKGNKQVILAFVNNISEKNKTKEKIRLLSAAVTQGPVGIIITDTNGKIKYTNPKFTEMTGYTAKDVIGRTPGILKSGKQTDTFYKKLWDTITLGYTWNGEFCNRKKNGELYWEKASIKPIINDKGEIIFFVSVKEDITAYKIIREKLIKSEKHFRLLFENSILGMYRTTPNGKIVKANKAFCKILGYNSFSEIKNCNLETDCDVTVNRLKIKNTIEKNGYITGFESIWKDKKNKLKYVRENVVELQDEKGDIYFEGIVENITEEKRKEKELQEIHELNKQIINVGELGYAIYKRNGECVFVSDNYATILGTDTESILNQNFREKRNWKKLQLINIAIECIKTGSSEKRLIEGTSNFNKEVWIELNFRRIYKGVEPRLLVIIKDISSYMRAKRKQIQTKSEYLSLIGSINLPIFGIDIFGKIKEWNNAAEMLTGHSRNKVKNKHFKDIFIIREDSVFSNLMSYILSGNSITNEELDIKTKKGILIRMLISSTTQIDENENVSRIICIAQDITEREIYKADLEKKVEERTHKLIEALEKEKELSELKSQFVSMASHEFRTPLSAIKFAAGFVKKYYDRAEKEKILKKAEKIETQVNHMTKLLEDVLTIGKIENGKIKYNPQRIDMIEELETIIEDVIIATKNSHKINFKCNKNKCIITSDTKILRNIFINLLSNAIKFSPDADEVIFNVSVNKKDIKFEVIDKGIGIKEEELKSIFNPFRRGRNVETIQGTGLGLAIVKESVELLKGDVTVESDQRKGTKFTIILQKQQQIRFRNISEQFIES